MGVEKLYKGIGTVRIPSDCDPGRRGGSLRAGTELMVLWLVDGGALDRSALPRPLVPREADPLALLPRGGLWAAMDWLYVVLMRVLTRSERHIRGRSAGILHA